MMRAVALLILLLVGCASEQRASSEGLDRGNQGGFRCEPSNGAITASPATLGRGANQQIEVLWDIRAGFAIATLTAGHLEVELPMAETSTGEYVASLPNPFGALAPPGEVHVSGRASFDGCFDSVNATTSFMLE